LKEFDAAQATPESAASITVNLSVPQQIFNVPHGDADPIRTLVGFSSVEWFGISIE
jgi:hypothetical protein